MGLVAVIDDRKDVRKRLSKKFSRYLKQEGISWDVQHFDPLNDILDYPKWISHNKIVILIVDEKLRETPKISGGFHSYDGHDLVREIRKTNKQLPIYVVTAHADDEILIQMEGEFEGVIQRDKFHEDESSNQQFKRIVRATQTYLENFNKEYLRLAELSGLIALNKATIEEKDELKALQAKMEIPLSSFISINRQEWIDELDNKTKELEELSSKIENFLKE
ncbi:MAG: CheY-like chemotaxis protein [Flavobacterium sp.]|jgi:CheY-like chemotaxis protein